MFSAFKTLDRYSLSGNKENDIMVIINKKMILRGQEEWFLLHNWAGDLLAQPFHPEKICMVPETGQFY